MLKMATVSYGIAVFVDPRGIPPPQSVAPEMCRKPCKKNDANEQRKRAHDRLWGEYFGSQVVPGRGIKGEGNLPLGTVKVSRKMQLIISHAVGP